MDATNIPATPVTTAQIGKCGEILVQYRLLKHGIESSPMTTDAGIDLVAYAPASRRAITIQVKTNLKAKPAGGKGALQLEWRAPIESPAELFALVDLATESVWLFTHAEVKDCAQQRSNGRLHFYLYTEPGTRPRDPGTSIGEFDEYRIENRIGETFGQPHSVYGSLPEAFHLEKKSAT